MKYCPIRSAAGNGCRDCFSNNCALWDEAAKGCLIRTFLISQIEKSDIVVKPVEEKIEKLEKDIKTVGLGFPLVW